MRAPVVLASGHAVQAIRRESLASSDGNETGGILLGHDNGATLMITAAGDPGPDAKRSQTAFTRDVAHAQALADTAYEYDCSLWIGEWHTHPRGPTAPSMTDLATYMSLLSDPRLGFARVLSVLVTPDAQRRWVDPRMRAFVVQQPAGTPGAVEVTVCEMRLGSSHALGAIRDQVDDGSADEEGQHAR